MKLAFSSNAFRKYSIEQTIEILAGIGYDGIELMCDVPHAWPPDLTDARIRSIKDALRRNKLRLSNLNAFMMCAIGDFHHPSWIEPDPAYRRKRIEHTRACVELAAKLGAKNLSTEPGGPVPKGWSRKKAMDAFYRGLAQVEPLARKHHVKVLVEPEPGLLIETSEQFDEFIAAVDSPWIGLNCDLGHFEVVGERPQDVVRKFGRRIEHVHLEDIRNRTHFHLPPGEGQINLRAVMDALKEIGYDGWVTIELYPFQQKAPEVARRSFEYIRRLM